MATTKGGDRGWSSWVSMPTPRGFSRFISFNPFSGEKAILQELFTPEAPYPVSMGWSIISVPIDHPLPEQYPIEVAYESFFEEEELLKEEPLGSWHLPVTRVSDGGNPSNTYYSTGRVRGVPFKGIRKLLERLSRPNHERFIFLFSGKMYSYDLSYYQEKGEVVKSTSKTLKGLFEENFAPCSVLQGCGRNYTRGIEPNTFYVLDSVDNNNGLSYSAMLHGYKVWQRREQVTYYGDLFPVEGTHWEMK